MPGLCRFARRGRDGAGEEVGGVRASFEARLDADWPGYVAKALTNARPAA